MHGRPRKSTTAAESAASIAKSAKLRDLQTQLIHNHQNKLYTKEAVLTSAKLLEINPEVYTAWNYRKLAVQHNLEGVGGADVVKSLVDDELRTVEMALRRNPKSYGAWHHRKWVLSQRLSETDFGREFLLLDQLLKADPRNFHGWNYRRFIAKMKNVSEVEELKFTMDMINTNFSNYSAWHNRSALLSQLLKQKAEGFDTKENILTEEYELVRQALFTDPSDQSGWFYHLWLLDQTVTLDYPLLISSWPSQGSDWVLTTDANCFKLSPSLGSNCHYSLHMGTLPIILYFNQAVSGVNSSTVTVNSIFSKNEELFWRPLSTTKSREAHCWVLDLNISDAEFENSMSSTVEVSIGHSRGIISSCGSHYPHTLQLKFTISVKSIYKETAEEPLEELVMWNDVQKQLDQINANEISFDKLCITKEHEPQVSKWNLETLSNEIELFKELSEEKCKFVNLTLARLLSAQDFVTSQGNILLQKRAHSHEVLELFNDLVKLDPSHARYYEDEQSLLIMNQTESETEVGRLIDDLGLRAKQQFPISQNKRYIAKNGLPQLIPSNPIALIKSNILSAQSKLKIILEPFVWRRSRKEDSLKVSDGVNESVGQFFSRHFGTEVVDYLIDPFVAGISGGDPESLSMRHTFPELWNLEKKFGSIIVGAIRSRASGKPKDDLQGKTPASSGKKKRQRGSFSFQGGMQALTDMLCMKLGNDSLKLCSKVLSLSCDPDGSSPFESWSISYAANHGNLAVVDQSFDAIIMTAPLHNVQEMTFTKRGKPFALDFFPKVNYLPLSVIITSFKKESVKRPLEGFGVLVPSKEQENGLKTLGTLFSSMMFPDRAPSDQYLYTTFVGGSRNRELASAPLDKLKEVVTSDLRKLLGAEGQPTFVKHIYWRNAFPLYGHDYDLVLDAIEKMEKNLPGFFYAGNHRDGLSVGKSITSGLRAADLAISYLNANVKQDA